MTADKLHEECGVFGIYSNNGLDVSRITYYALFALQHRGQESCGMAVNDNNTINCIKNLGLVSDVFNDDILDKLKGKMAVGHVRYSSFGDNTVDNSQPHAIKYAKGTLTIAYNGNIINAGALRRELEQAGAIFHTNCHTEVIAFLIAKERLIAKSVEEAVMRVLPKLKGSYSMVIMSPKKMIAVRDGNGIRPLCMGKIEDSYVFSSESCAFGAIGADFVRDIAPGEVAVINADGVKSYNLNPDGKTAACVFEHIYFARPDSFIDGQGVYEARMEAGRILASVKGVDADMVMGVPDSGLCAAIGYSNASGIPYVEGLLKNRYIGRTFIQPSQALRQKNVSIKLNVLTNNVSGKRIVLIDDSIVRGTTTKNIIRMLKKAGAKEVHVRISSPEFVNACPFGTDIPDAAALASTRYSSEQLAAVIGADSLAFLPLDRVKDIAPNSKYDFCTGCFSGVYPIDYDGKPDDNPPESGKVIINRF